MLLIAEIADKIPTMLEHWLIMVVPTVVVVAVFSWHSLLRFVGLFISVLVSGFWAWVNYEDAYYGPIADDIQSKLGIVWIANSVVSAFLPAFIMLAILMYSFLLRREKASTPRLCASA